MATLRKGSKRLKNIHYNRVDLVDIGACLDTESGEGSHILLTKRAPQGAGDRNMARASEVSKALSEVRKLFNELGSEEIRKGLTAEELDELETVVKAGADVVLDQVEDEEETDLVDDEDDDAVASDDDADEEEDDDEEETVSFTESEFDRAVAEVLADMGIEDGDQIEFVDGDDEGEEFAADGEGDEADEAAGVIMEAVGKRDTLIAKRFADLQDRVDAAEAIAKSERDGRILSAFVEKTRQFKRLPLNPEKDGALLKRMSENLSEADFRRVTQILKAADATKGASFAETGAEMAENIDTSTAWGEIQKRAKGLVKKSAGQLNEAAAIAEVIEQDHALYERYVDEQRSGRR